MLSRVFALALILQAYAPLELITITHRFDTITGTLVGRVFIVPNTPFPGVRIRAVNLETGNTRASITDLNGQYRIALLPPGRYSVDAFKEGYIITQPTSQPIRVQLNRIIEPVPDIIMALATVAAAPPAPSPAPSPTSIDSLGRLVNGLDAARRFNFDSRQLSVLPLAGSRTFDDLALLAPGVIPAPEVRGVSGPGLGSGIGSPGQFAVNGLRARSNNFTVDGAGNNDEDVGVRRQGFAVLTSQSVESVRELQVVTQLWDSEQGRNFGSQVNAISKAGANQVHGGFYGFYNNHALNARDPFDLTAITGTTPLLATAVESYLNGRPVNPIQIPVTVRSQAAQPGVPVLQADPAGGENNFRRLLAGGNISFPVSKDRTFGFASYEHLRLVADQETHFSVPTIGERGFLGFGATGFITDQGGQQQLYTPTFVAGDAAFSLYPFPNNRRGPFGDNTYTQILRADAEGSIFSFRLDHEFKSSGGLTSHQLTGRYNFAGDERVIPSVGEAIRSSVASDVRTQNLSLFLNSQLNASVSNQARASFGRSRLRFLELRDPSLSASRFVQNEPYLLNAGMLLNGSDPRFQPTFVDYFQRSAAVDSVEDHLGTLGQIVISPYSPVGLAVDLFPQGRVNNTFQFADTIVLASQDHSLRAGVDFVRTELNSFLNRNYRPQIYFGGTPDLTVNSSFNPIFSSNPLLLRGLSAFGPTPGYFRGADLAALGLPTAITQSLRTDSPPDSSLGLRFWQMNYFITDQWRVRSGLSLSYGLRYEYNTPPRDSQRRIEQSFELLSPGTAGSPVSICRPFTNCSQVFSGDALNAAYTSTLGELGRFLDGRQGIYDPDRNNFSPHFGFAWVPFAGNSSDVRTVVRGGASINYDLLIGNLVSQSRNVFPNFIPLNVDANTFAYASQVFFIPGQTGAFAAFNPRFVPVIVRRDGVTQQFGLVGANQLNRLGTPDDVFTQIAGLLFAPPPVALSGLNLSSGGGLAFTLPDRRLRSPYAINFNLQIEHELSREWLLNLAYVGAQGRKLARFRTPNGGVNSITLPIDPLGLTMLGGGAPAPAAVAVAPSSNIDAGIFRRPNPGLGSITIFDSSAASIYHSLQANVQKRFGRGFMLTAAHTFGHAIDDVSDLFDLAGASALPQNDSDLRAERGNANFDLRHRFAASIVAELPFLKLLNISGEAGRRIFGGWQTAFITVHQSGQPFTAASSLDVNLDGNLTDRLNRIVGLETNIDRRVRLRPAADLNLLGLLAPVGGDGGIGRNTFRSATFHQTDLALMKVFNVHSEQSLTLRVECFNLWNRPQFAVPERILEAPGFGAASATRGPARQVQFALKYTF